MNPKEAIKRLFGWDTGLVEVKSAKEGFNDFKDLKVLSPQERVFSALANPKWNYWTCDGLGYVSGLSEDYVREVIKAHPERIRQTGFYDYKGREVFTLASKPVTLRERFETFRYLLSVHAP